jgi:hypothetical protein
MSIQEGRTVQAGRHADREQNPHRSPGIASMVTLAAVLALAACGANASENFPPYTAPANWQDVSPPTSDPIASYAISPDVPGLIVACTGSKTGNMSASPLGPATLWRTRDGGAHWQRLAVSGYIAGCEVAFPPGGSGTLFALNLDGGQFIQVSHDAGDTWKTLARDDGAPYGDIQQRFTLLAHGVYRDGRLYTAGQADTAAAASTAATATASSMNPPPAGASTARDVISLAFSISSDDSQTWTAVEAAPDPLIQQGYVPLAIAADYRAPGAWFRLWGLGYASSRGGAMVLEQSTDGGQTWQPMPLNGARGTYRGLGDGGSGSATLATQPGQPARLCAAFSPQVNDQSVSLPPSGLKADAVGFALRGPPPPIPHDITLAGSDDGGQTWSAAIIGRHQRDYGAAAGPGVAMDPHGNCYLADVSSQGGDTTNDLVTIWRLAPGRDANPAVIERITGQSIVTFAINLDSANHVPRLVAVAYVYSGPTEIICQGNMCPPEPPLPLRHLIWAPAP